MKSGWIRHPSVRYLALLLLCGVPASLYAQQALSMTEVMARLDRLEKDNEALTEEIRALRKDLATALHLPEASSVESASTSAGETAAAEASSSVPEESRQVERSRIDELAQTKVEASQKFPIRLTGMVLVNAYTNGRFNNESDNPTLASVVPGAVAGGATLRQTTIGLLYNGPTTVAGGKVTGSLYFDFFGGSTSSLNHSMHLRTAEITLGWAHTSVSIGQQKPLIVPRDPDSLAQVGVSPLTGAGNLWLWQPQIRLEQRFALGQDAGITAQVAGVQTSLLSLGSDPGSYVETPPTGQVENSTPGGEARLMLWRRWRETGRLEIAGGFHANHNHVVRFSLPTNVYTLDWFFRPLSKVEFSGSYFHGRNVAILGGLQQGYSVLPGRIWLSVRSNGGWAQLRFPVTERLAFNVYGGQEDDRNKDLLPGSIGKNQAYFANAMYRIAPNVLVSLEGGQVRTSYLQIGNRLNDHYDLGIAYLF